MAIDYPQLRTELLLPAYAAFLAAGNDQGAADSLNAASSAMVVRSPLVPIWRVLAWAAAEGRFERVQAAATSGAPGIKSLAACALKILDALADVNLDAPEFRALLTALVSAAVLTVADRDALLALGDRSPASRAEVLFGAGVAVSSSDVARALRGTP